MKRVSRADLTQLLVPCLERYFLTKSRWPGKGTFILLVFIVPAAQGKLY
jgi:hypothetical protein